MPPELPEEISSILQLMDGFRASKSLFTAVSMGLFDRLHEEPSSLQELADDLCCPPHALERLLGVCCAWGLLRTQGGRYLPTEPAVRYLRRKSPETLAGYILYSNRVLYRLWGRLEDAVREGSHQWEAEFGSKDDIFEHFFATAESRQTFLSGMHGLGLLSSPAVVEAFDLSAFHHLADIGGATGHLAIAACQRYRVMHATVFDLPRVTPAARGYIDGAGLADRIETVDGDFFRDPLPSADLYALGRILHDWSDPKVRFLLQKVFDSLPAGGALLICERLLDEEKDGPVGPLLQSLNMLVCTEGRERSTSEYEALLREAGFREFQSKRTGRPLDAMLARK